MGAAEESVSIEDLIPLLDTRFVELTQVSCLATALREARALVGRRPEDGGLHSPEHGMTWAGALVYLIYCEQIGACFRPADHPHSRRRNHELADALAWFGGFPESEARLLNRMRERLAHDYTLSSPSPDGPTFALHGGAHEPVVDTTHPHVMVGLPALAIRIETTFNMAILQAANEGRLVCHHPGGLDGVGKRFRMAIIEAG